MQFGESLTVWRNISPSFSRLNSNPSTKPAEAGSKLIEVLMKNPD
jgi:hypothetical protein